MAAKDPDAYLAALSADKRATLQKVRTAIRAAAPDAVEAMSYGMPAFILGKPIAGYSAGARHCAYFPMSGAVTGLLKHELKAYDVSKGGFRFPIGKPPPAALIRKLVKARIAELGAAAPGPRRKTTPTASEAVDASAHPLHREIDAVRRIILGASPAISEGVKWNAPSFRTEKGWFATIHLRRTESLDIVLHLGAKTRADLKAFSIADPDGLLKWLGKDRAMLSLGKGRAIVRRRAAIEAIVRAWIGQL